MVMSCFTKCSFHILIFQCHVLTQIFVAVDVVVVVVVTVAVAVT